MRVWEWGLPSIGGLLVEATPHRTQLTGLQEQIHESLHTKNCSYMYIYVYVVQRVHVHTIKTVHVQLTLILSTFCAVFGKFASTCMCTQKLKQSEVHEYEQIFKIPLCIHIHVGCIILYIYLYVQCSSG